jgi:ubiquinone/menaquinone biosynthesis C-methylase UbiE
MNALDVVEAAFKPLTGKRLLDVGCGSGDLSRALAQRGALPVGVDPSPDAIRRAHANAPDLSFCQAAAEALPVRDGAMAGVVVLNALHHVPEPAMTQALREARRVTADEGAVVVIEPLAVGSFFSALLTVEDETAVRAAAQRAIRDALDAGVFALLRTVDYVRRERFESADGFLAKVVAADQARAAVVARKRDEVEAAFARYAARDQDGVPVLEQPIRAHILRPLR